MNRAESSTTLLSVGADGATFLDLVAATIEASALEVHGYCLLERHYHLLIRASAESLAASIELFERRWAARLGAAAVSPFAAKPRLLPVRLGRHLAEVSRYVHLNPFEAGLAWRPEDWPHSSYRGYLGDASAPDWLRTDAVLAHFGSIGARHRYRAYVEAGMDPGTRDADGRPRWGALFREGSLAEELAWRVDPFLLPGPDSDGTPSCGVAPPPPLSVLAREVAEAFGLSIEELRSRQRGKSVTAALARGALVHAARQAGGHRLCDVAAWMGYASPRAAAVAAARFERSLTLRRTLAIPTGR